MIKSTDDFIDTSAGDLRAGVLINARGWIELLN
jgi:hypothetical protein